MKRVLACLLLTICCCSAAFAQSPKDEQNEKMLKQAADKAKRAGAELTTQITVANNVTASSVLIPRTDAERIFGKEIAKKYMVIEVNVGNKSPDAALIIHGIFMDYSGWVFAGLPPRRRSSKSANDNPSAIYQASTRQNEVASEEYRVVRGQLLDAQMWTKRNLTVRLLTLAGNLAGAYTFALKEKGIIQGIAAATGVGIPGFANTFPDPTVEQLNRVSDFGYRANSLIPKQGAGVIVCFFPIDRFLSPGFRKLFLKSPALFFAPGQMLLDKKIRKDVVAVLGEDLGIQANPEELAHALPCFLSVIDSLSDLDNRFIDKPCLDSLGLIEGQDTMGKYLVVKTDPGSQKNADLFRALVFLSRASLNLVTLTVDGVMSVDTTAIAARADGIEFEKVVNCGDDKSQCFWANVKAANGVRTGTIPGSYLTGGNVVIAEANDLGLTEVKAITENSSDQVLHFSFKLTNPVPPQTKLHFTVSKPQPGAAGANAKSLDSLPREYVVDYPTSAPINTSVKQEDNKLTVKGSGFSQGKLVVSLHPPAGDDVEVTPTSVSDDGTQMVLTIPVDAKPAGCWTVVVKVDDLVAPQATTKFVVKPTPTLDSATRDTTRKTIIVTGDDLIDTTGCGGPKLSFQLQKEGVTPKAATLLALDPANRQAVLRLPTANEGAGWTVHVLLAGKDIANVELK